MLTNINKFMNNLSRLCKKLEAYLSGVRDIDGILISMNLYEPLDPRGFHTAEHEKCKDDLYSLLGTFKGLNLLKERHRKKYSK